jgi:putative membrane protein
MMWGYGYGGGWWMVLVVVLIAAVMIAAVVLAVIFVSRTVSPAPSGGASAVRSILEERFARGEIDEDEFKCRLGTLGSQR